MVNTLTPRKKPVNTLVPKKKPVNTLVPKRKPVNTLVPKKKVKTDAEKAKEARDARIAKLKAKRGGKSTVRPRVLAPPKNTFGSKKSATKKKAMDEDDLDDFIVDDSEDEMGYYEAETDDEGAGSDLEEDEEFKGKTLAQKEKILKARQDDRKGNIEALIARLEAKAQKKSKGFTAPSEEAFGVSCCEELKQARKELDKVRAELRAVRRQRKSRSSKPKKSTTVDIKPVPKNVSDAVRKARIEKIMAKRAAGRMKLPSRAPRKPRARKPLKECKTGYTRSATSKRCKKEVAEAQDSEKVKFAKAMIAYDTDVLRRKTTGEKNRGSGKRLLAKINSYFDENMAMSKKQRLQNKQQSEAFNAARQIYYLNNPGKNPRRKSVKK